MDCPGERHRGIMGHPASVLREGCKKVRDKGDMFVMLF